MLNVFGDGEVFGIGGSYRCIVTDLTFPRVLKKLSRCILCFWYWYLKLETFNKYFKNLVLNLDLKVPNNLLCQTPKNDDKLSFGNTTHQNHPRIKAILEKYDFSFSFKTVFLTDVKKGDEESRYG